MESFTGESKFLRAVPRFDGELALPEHGLIELVLGSGILLFSNESNPGLVGTRRRVGQAEGGSLVEVIERRGIGLSLHYSTNVALANSPSGMVTFSNRAVALLIRSVGSSSVATGMFCSISPFSCLSTIPAAAFPSL